MYKPKTILRTLLINFLLILASVVFALLFMEGGMRLLGITPQEMSLSRIMMLDDHCGFKLRPGSRIAEVPGILPEVKINSLGMRDREYSVKKPPQSRRILALGDSFAYGRVHYDFNFLTLLENQLNKKNQGKPIEILNTGIPAYQPVNYLTYLHQYGLQYEPDAVLLCFYVGNDLWENDKSALDIHPEIPLHREKEALEKLPFYSVFKPFRLYWSIVNMTTKARILADVKKRMPDIDQESLDDPRKIVPGFSFMSEEQYDKVIKKQMRSYLKPEFRNDWDRQNLRDTMSIIKQIEQTCRQHHILFAVTLLPTEPQTNPKVWDRMITLAKGIITEPEFDRQEPQKSLVDMLEREKIGVVDMLEPFQKGGSKQRLYLLRDSHWNEAGNQLAADLLYDPVKNWIESAHPAP